MRQAVIGRNTGSVHTHSSLLFFFDGSLSRAEWETTLKSFLIQTLDVIIHSYIHIHTCTHLAQLQLVKLACRAAPRRKTMDTLTSVSVWHPFPLDIHIHEITPHFSLSITCHPRATSMWTSKQVRLYPFAVCRAKLPEYHPHQGPANLRKPRQKKRNAPAPPKKLQALATAPTNQSISQLNDQLTSGPRTTQ